MTFKISMNVYKTMVDAIRHVLTYQGALHANAERSTFLNRTIKDVTVIHAIIIVVYEN